MTLLTFHSNTFRSLPPVVNFLIQLPINFNNPFQRKSCTRTCNLILEYGRCSDKDQRRKISHFKGTEVQQVLFKNK